jgi:hypothetical protein
MSLDLLPGLVSLTNKLSAPIMPAAAASSAPSGREPDPDTIKMFVGQVPRTMSEQDLINFFQVKKTVL